MDGQMFRRNQTYAPLNRALQGLESCGWHALRHTFASHLVMRGATLKAVQDLMGHSTILMTMRYAHLAPDVVRSAVKLLDLVADDSGSAKNLPKPAESSAT
jgi:site-specific recombinase XerD